MKRDSSSEEYTELFLQFSTWVEKMLFKALIVTLIGLCLFQTALRIPALRGYIASADKFEGVSIDRAVGR
ncbi:hypothetical protein D3C77_251140 [compost metagenome]